jgi:hypothetical protein
MRCAISRPLIVICSRRRAGAGRDGGRSGSGTPCGVQRRNAGAIHSPSRQPGYGKPGGGRAGEQEGERAPLRLLGGSLHCRSTGTAESGCREGAPGGRVGRKRESDRRIGAAGDLRRCGGGGRCRKCRNRHDTIRDFPGRLHREHRGARRGSARPGIRQPTSSGSSGGWRRAGSGSDGGSAAWRVATWLRRGDATRGRGSCTAKTAGDAR